MRFGTISSVGLAIGGAIGGAVDMAVAVGDGLGFAGRAHIGETVGGGSNRWWIEG